MNKLRLMMRNNPFYAKQMFRLQVFLLRHNLAKRLSAIAMVITTTGRTTGKRRSTPIGYLREGATVLAFTYPHHHWYKNLRKNPRPCSRSRARRSRCMQTYWRTSRSAVASSRPTSASARAVSRACTSSRRPRPSTRSSRRRKAGYSCASGQKPKNRFDPPITIRVASRRHGGQREGGASTSAAAAGSAPKARRRCG